MDEQTAQRHHLGSAVLGPSDELVRLTPLPSSAVSAIRSIPAFSQSNFANLNIDLALDFMVRRYVRPLADNVGVRGRVIADCAAGYGWLSFAFLLSGGERAVLIDADAKRVDTSRQIAEVLGIADRCEFITGFFQRLSLAENSVDIFASVETLEHVGKENIPLCIQTMASAAREAVLVTTPNFMFPAIAHDTYLPLAHWLPASVRSRYAGIFGRRHMDYGNAFVRPWQLQPLRRRFQVATRYQTFRTAEELDRFYPHYRPYFSDESKRYRQHPPPGLRLLHKLLATTFGNHAYAFAPNLMSIWIRRQAQ